jgi:orotate phosphoribosyltransferase
MQNVSKIANALYSSGCLKFGEFRIKSGAISPYYFDLASLMSSPKDLCTIASVAAEEIRQIMKDERVDKLASIELKGALILPSIGVKVNLPCIVVRKEKKAYGVTGRIVGGQVTEGDGIVFFDDVVSEGLSKIEGIKPLEQLGAEIKCIMVVVDREQGGKRNLEIQGYWVKALSKVSELIENLNQEGKIAEKQANTVLQYIRQSRQ